VRRYRNLCNHRFARRAEGNNTRLSPVTQQALC
jgi:hypothetical protein